MGSSRAVRAGRAYVELGANDRLTAALRAAERRVSQFGARVRGVGLRVAAIGTAITAPLAAATVSFARQGDAIEKASRRLGIGAEALSELGFAAEQSGANLEVLEKGVRTMQRGINDLSRGLSTQVDAFGDLGLVYRDLAELSPEAQFKLVADRLSQIEDASKRAAVAQMIFGRAGTQLLPLMEDGARGMEALQDEARALGVTISATAARDAAALTDALNRANVVSKSLRRAIGEALAPAVTRLADQAAAAGIRIVQFVQANREAVVVAAAVGVALLGLGGALLSVAVGAIVLSVGLKVLVGAMGLLGAGLGVVAGLAAALVSPIGLAAAAAIAAGVAFVRWNETASAALSALGARLGGFVGLIRGVVGASAQALLSGDLEGAAEIAWAGLLLVWEEGTSGIRVAFGEAMDWIVARLPFSLDEMMEAAEGWWIEFKAGFAEAVDFITSEVLPRLVRAWNRVSAEIEDLATEIILGPDSGFTREQIADQRRAGEESRRIARENAEARKAAAEESASALGGAAGEVQDAVSPRLEAARQRLEEARRRFDEAVARSEARRSEEAGVDPRIGDLISSIDDLAAGVRAESVRGVLGTFDLRSLQGAAGDDRVARASEEVAENTSRMVDILRRGPVFV